VRVRDKEVFPGVDYRDKMHGGFIFLHRVVTELLDEIPFRPKTKTRTTLDNRLVELSAQEELIYLRRDSP